MATSPEFHPRPLVHSPIFPRALHTWWLAVPFGVLALTVYCELHALITGRPSVGLDVSAPWAVRVAFGWIAVSALVLFAGPRVAVTSRVAQHPRLATALSIVAIVAFTLACEWLMAGSNRWQDASAFLYDRLPLHGALAALLLAVCIPRPSPSRQERASTCVEIAPAATPTCTIEVMTGTGKTSIRVDEIEQIEADGNYLCVHHSSGRTYLLRQTLSGAERSLPATVFIRVHRSTIVNRDMIRERRSGGILVLRSGRTVRIGRAYRDHAAAPDPRIH